LLASFRTEQTYLKLIFGTAAALVAVVLIAWGGFRAYRTWQERHLVRQSAAYLGGGDMKAATLTARRALQLNPDNIDATRLIAQIADRSGDRTAVDWWRKVVGLGSHGTDDALGLVRAALRNNDFATAENTLAAFDEAGKRSAGYQAACGRLAEMKKRPVEAESHWAKASEAAPNDPAYQFQLALLRLDLGDAAKREAALQTLARLRADPKQRTGATRALIIDGVAHQADVKRMQSLASELQSYPEASFGDRILYLEILRQLHDPDFEEYLKKLQGESAANPVDLTTLFSWMSGNETAAAGIEFSKTLPPESLAKWPVPAALAGLHSSAKDWIGLERMTRSTDWQANNFLRHAYLARALREQDKKLPSEQEWLAAQKEASPQPQSVLVLARAAATWGWENETAELLWALTRNDEIKMEALQTLYQHYTAKHDTSGLYRTLVRLVETEPNDHVLQNNLAQVSLLLGADLERARKIAAELASKEPSNGSFLSTYAFSLYAKGDIKGAVRAMETLTPEQLRDPSVATYYGIILAAAGQKEKAQEYLRRASEAKLLPEEKALIAKAESALQ
jgi:Flp pilus assembly protein TadD